MQRWDGFDQDHLVDLRGDSRLALIVTAFRLPRPVILTRGNADYGYRSWNSMVSAARGHFLPRYRDAATRRSLTFLEPTRSAEGNGVIRAPVGIRVDVAGEDRCLLQQGVNEVSFHVDHVFVSEEEHGSLPFTWLLDPSSLSAGQHLLTVSISGLDGRMAVKSLAFQVGEERPVPAGRP